MLSEGSKTCIGNVDTTEREALCKSYKWGTATQRYTIITARPNVKQSPPCPCIRLLSGIRGKVRDGGA